MPITDEQLDNYIGSLTQAVHGLTAAMHKQTQIMTLWILKETNGVCPGCVATALDKAPPFDPSRVNVDLENQYHDYTLKKVITKTGPETPFSALGLSSKDADPDAGPGEGVVG